MNFYMISDSGQVIRADKAQMTNYTVTFYDADDDINVVEKTCPLFFNTIEEVRAEIPEFLANALDRGKTIVIRKFPLMIV